MITGPPTAAAPRAIKEQLREAASSILGFWLVVVEALSRLGAFGVMVYAHHKIEPILALDGAESLERALRVGSATSFAIIDGVLLVDAVWLFIGPWVSTAGERLWAKLDRDAVETG